MGAHLVLSKMNPKNGPQFRNRTNGISRSRVYVFRPVSPVNFSGLLLEDTSVSNANLGFTKTNDPEARDHVVSRIVAGIRISCR